MEEKTKRCPRCGRTLPISEFGSNKSKKDGHSDYCIECSRELVREAYYRKKAKKAGASVQEEEKKPIREEVRKTNEGIKKAEKPSLLTFSVSELADELKGRGVNVLINPQPRDLMLALKAKGYTGTLEFTVKQTISLAAIN